MMATPCGCRAFCEGEDAVRNAVCRSLPLPRRAPLVRYGNLILEAKPPRPEKPRVYNYDGVATAWHGMETKPYKPHYKLVRVLSDKGVLYG
jgi:hypothetical protein